MFAVGFLMFVPAVLLAFYVGAGNVKVPEWVELVGGGAIVLGVILMAVSACIRWAPVMWHAMP